MKEAMLAREYSLEIIAHAEEHNQRTGQYLYNSFPLEVAAVVNGTLFDPFHRNMSQYQIEAWLLNHIVFDEHGSIIAVFNNNQILWERKY